MIRQLDKLRRNRALVDAIDWEMTPEEAVRLYLEWGNNWARGNYVIRSKSDVSHYFVVNTWGQKPVIYLVRRNSEQADELAKLEMPAALDRKFRATNGTGRGVYAVDGEVRQWLKKALDA